MNRFLLLASITALSAAQMSAAQAAPSPSNPTYCTWNEKQIAQGESIWVEDPVLKASGASRDWQGFRLICQPLFKPEKTEGDSNIVGAGLEKVGVGLVLGDYSRDFFNDFAGKSHTELGNGS
ncbi:hypothetical protein [Shewanella colwelliana]|uniref:hypothetical protein n=1 Tax=Shewanella colwelliana TaxID=23 RepID=UPI0022AEB57D|nr:hypothetical protein [Shewanella colwelliana]MCZ4339744.1 hypothetical protein [Shewanella colwelliana]